MKRHNEELQIKLRIVIYEGLLELYALNAHIW